MIIYQGYMYIVSTETLQKHWKHEHLHYATYTRMHQCYTTLSRL